MLGCGELTSTRGDRLGRIPPSSRQALGGSSLGFGMWKCREPWRTRACLCCTPRAAPSAAFVSGSGGLVEECRDFAHLLPLGLSGTGLQKMITTAISSSWSLLTAVEPRVYGLALAGTVQGPGRAFPLVSTTTPQGRCSYHSHYTGEQAECGELRLLIFGSQLVQGGHGSRSGALTPTYCPSSSMEITVQGSPSKTGKHSILKGKLMLQLSAPSQPCETRRAGFSLPLWAKKRRCSKVKDLLRSPCWEIVSPNLCSFLSSCERALSKP